MNDLKRLLESRKKELRLIRQNEELQDAVGELQLQTLRQQEEVKQAKQDADHHRQVSAALAATLAAPAQHQPPGPTTPTGPLLSEAIELYCREKVSGNKVERQDGDSLSGRLCRDARNLG